MADEIKISMVNPTGRVVWVNANQVEEMKQKGWRTIINPKEAYYPQFDTTLNPPKPETEDTTTRILQEKVGSTCLGIESI